MASIFNYLLEDELGIARLDKEKLESINYIRDGKRIFSPYLLDHYVSYRWVLFELFAIDKIILPKYSCLRSHLMSKYVKFCKILNLPEIREVCRAYNFNHITSAIIADYVMTPEYYWSLNVTNMNIIFSNALQIYENPFRKNGTSKMFTKFAVCGTLPTRRELSSTGHSSLRNSRYFPRLVNYIKKYMHIDEDIARRSSLVVKQPNGIYFIPNIFYIISDVGCLCDYDLNNQ